jgi:WD40 repeat protein
MSLGPQDLAALACSEGVRVLSLATGREKARCSLPRPERPVQVAWSPWARHLATLHDGGDVVVWDLESETPVHVLRAHTGRATQLAFSHDGRWLAVACDDRSVHVFNAAGVEVRSMGLEQLASGGEAWQAPVRSITALAFAPDRPHLLVGGDDGMVRQLDARGGVVRGWRHTHGVSALAVCTDRIATGSQDGRVRTWGWDGSVISRLDGGQVRNAAFAAAGDMLGAVADTSCALWDRSGQVVGTASLSSRGVGLGFPSSATLITATDAGMIEAWSARPATREGGGT